MEKLLPPGAAPGYEPEGGGLTHHPDPCVGALVRWHRRQFTSSMFRDPRLRAQIAYCPNNPLYPTHGCSIIPIRSFARDPSPFLSQQRPGHHARLLTALFVIVNAIVWGMAMWNLPP